MTKRIPAIAIITVLVLFGLSLIACPMPNGEDGSTTPAPEIQVSQNTVDLPSGTGQYDFGSSEADGNDVSASAYMTFTIANAGTADLVISSFSIAGDDFDKTDPASTVIAASGSTTFTVRFDPLTTGSKSSTVTINNNDADEEVYTFQVTGTGTAVPAPEIIVQQGVTDLLDGAGSFDFGSVVADGDGNTASSYVTFAIRNLGTADLTISSLTISGSDFDKTDPASTVIAASGSTTFTVRFDPLTTGSKSSTVTINNNDADEGVYTFQVTGSGTTVPEPEILVQQGVTDLLDGAGSFDFGSVVADGDGNTASSYATFTIRNPGTADLTISSLTISGSDFDKTDPLSSTISPSGSTTFTVRFDPLTTGSKSSTVTINNNDADEGAYTFQVIGSGTAVPAPEINVQQGVTDLLNGTGSYDFGSVYADGDGNTASSYVTFTIRNPGTADLTISSLTISGSDFDKTDPLSSTIPSSGSTTFTVRFDPLTTGSKSSTVTINNNDADEGVYTFQVTGTGTAVPAPEINVQQGVTDLLNGTGTYDFGSVIADGDGNTASDYVTFTIQNLGTADLTISGLTISGYDFVDFDKTAPLSSTISPSGSTTFTVRFDPRTIYGKYSTIKITCNDADEGTYIFAVTGTGSGTPDIDIWQDTTNILEDELYNFGSVQADGVGGAASPWITFTVKNVGNAVLTLQSIQTQNQGGSGFGCTIFAAWSVLPGSSTTFTLQFDPETVGSKTGYLFIGSNDPDESPYTIELAGTGI